MEIFLGVGMFTSIVLLLVLVILFAKSKLGSSGDVTISINGDPEKAITTGAGDKLLSVLSNQWYFCIKRLWWWWFMWPMPSEY